MNRAQHYAEAERMLEHVEKLSKDVADMIARGAGTHQDVAVTLQTLRSVTARAQVHATLASVIHGVASQAARIASEGAADG